MHGNRWRMGGVVGIGLVALVVLAPTAAATAAEATAGAARGEELLYQWRLEGVSRWLSALLGLLPTSGDAVMALRLEADGRLGVAFTATSEKADKDDYWKYEAAVDPRAWHSLRVRETLRYGKKHKTESFDLAEHEVLDVLSGLQQLRYLPPDGSERRLIWSGGKVYPVSVTFNAFERREFDGRDLTVRHVSVRGIREPDQRFWKSWAELWISDDEAALPVELIFHQALGRLRMTLVGASGGGRPRLTAAD